MNSDKLSKAILTILSFWLFVGGMFPDIPPYFAGTLPVDLFRFFRCVCILPGLMRYLPNALRIQIRFGLCEADGSRTHVFFSAIGGGDLRETALSI